MEMRPSFQIPALIKSLTDVVLPAVDPANKLAQEQGQLVVAMLHLIAQRLPLQYRYDRHELDCHLALADTLASEAAAIPEAAEALRALAAAADAGRLKAVNRAVMDHAKAQLLRERAWLVMQGWEGPAAGLPDAASLIGG